MNISQSIIKKSVWKFNNSKLHVKTLESGLHSDLYLNTDFVVSDPKLVESIVKDIFVKELNSRNIKPDWIISYPPYGLPIAFELARQMNAKFGYINRKSNDCNFDIKKNETIIVIGDDIYSGGSIKETIQIVTSKGGIVKSPILTIGNFTGTKSIMDLDVVSAISEKGNLYEENICPMCKVGSKPVNPRTYWKKLKEE
jgi:orotate phosphoribosyltransferase